MRSQGDGFGTTGSSGSSAGAMDRERMAEAVRDFLRAAGIVLPDEELVETGRRVAETWAEELLFGHRADPESILAETAPATHDEPVVLSGIAFVGVCPHHLLPYEGRAAIVYLPGERVAGFGGLVRLVKALGARLVMQEELADDIVSALMDVLGARGAGCVLEAHHGCVGLRGVRQPEVLATTSAWRGALADPASYGRTLLETARREPST